MPDESSDSPDAALRASGLSRAFGEAWALREVDLELAHGSTLAVIGANGAGKSTLLRILATLLRPTEGAVEVMGCALPGEAWRLRGRIGYLGHGPMLYRDLSAEENLRFHARLFGLPDAGGERVGSLLEAVGLTHRATTRVGEMSAGMVQRLAICRAVLHEPELLLLDEPLAHLDPDAVAAVAPLLEGSPWRAERSRVLVTHEVETAVSEGDLVLALARDGSVAWRGPATELDPARAHRLYEAGGRSRRPATAGSSS